MPESCDVSVSKSVKREVKKGGGAKSGGMGRVAGRFPDVRNWEK